RSSAKNTHAVAAGLMFLCFFSASGYWFDLARVDMLFMLFALGAFYVLSGKEINIPRMVIAGALLVAATYTKQLGIFFAGTATLYLMTRDFKRGFLFGAATLTAILLIGFARHVKTDGQFTFYTITVGSSHEVHFERLLDPRSWLNNSWPLVLAALAVPLLKCENVNSFRPWLFFLLACVPAALLPWIKTGNYFNNFIPLFSGLCLLAAL
ncbi:MAG: hypothetical protein GY862_05490, partial [Gammaproteobacteria bacterium]|nr:hypothetical protein [Gammaproteobacteria bacterium]